MLIRLWRALFLALAVAGLPEGGMAASSDPQTSPAVTARLITAQDGVPEGAGTLSAGLDLKLGDGWKTYWRSPGEVGIPPSIDWAGSENIAGVSFLWPAPERFTAFGIENFGYRDEVVFPLRIALDRPGAPARLKALVSLLVCSDICVPQDFELSLSLPRGAGIDTEAATRIAAFAARVPVPGPESGIASAAYYLDADATTLTVALRGATAFRSPDIFPELGTGTAFGTPDIRLGDGGRDLWATFPVLSGGEATVEEAMLTVTDGLDRAVTLEPDRVETAPAPPFTSSVAGPAMGTLVSIALVAFLGGLILNAMPCVLPVLSIKLSSVVRHGARDRWDVRAGFLAAALGVLSFMWVLALVLFLLQRAGVTVGWGLQFQSPVFLALMILILSVFATNMLGGFEVVLPSRLQTWLANAGGSQGRAADFLTGLFGAVMATPCSAPFLGTAITFALAGRGVDIFIVFTGLGVGLAVPYLAVAAFPRAVAWMPKPGRWMTGLKLVLGALLAGTVAWLLFVMVGVAGPAAALAVGGLSALLVLALSVRRLPPVARWPVVAVCAALALATAPRLQEAPAPSAARASLDWNTFDRADIARNVSQGRVVFLDVTADWCLTCKANKALVIDRDPVRTALQADGVVAMQADWTRPDDGIARYLERFGRYGIPFSAVYGPGAPDGIVLSEILSADAVLAALRSATGDGEPAKDRTASTE
ncbi:protein-disulfide reductase DsbD family protein [Palleronia pelagia]|uniref:Suppressor for copper-sensitivity B n=1 Tax=Palleronia pelagia TaxID=387096 RepID=A0A1H8BCK0_9RHOB|nr:protein-disulfide reductase DsbD domain-containing protein [Palleronia pelagia]SEM80660.1 suppressor for copper-sensitivity B [Palleronia pelagia]